MKTKLTAIVVAAASALIAAPALAAVPRTSADPATLARGADVTTAYIDGTTFVNGDVQVELGGRYPWLLGGSGADHLVAVSDKNIKVRRIDPAGIVSTVLRVRDAASVHLSENGRKIVITGITGGKDQPRTIYSATTGKKLHSRTFDLYPTTLGMKGAKVLFTSSEGGTTWWNTRTDTTRLVTRRLAGEVDFRNDLLASYTADVYEGGCMLLTSLSDPGTRIWRSCKERVEGISPDGEMIATVPILSDGIGPREVTVRTVTGTRVATYATTGWFGQIDWEDDDTIVLESHGKKQSALVRCTLAACENATDPKPTEDPVGDLSLSRERP